MFDTLSKYDDKNAILGFVAGAIDDGDNLPTDRLAEIEPGPYLTALLGSLDAGRLSPTDRVKVLAAQQRMASFFAARQMESIEAIAEVYESELGDDELVSDAVAGELRAGLTLTRRAAESEVELALRLRRDLPDVWKLLASGAIDARKARVIVREVAHLDRADARVVIAPILEHASRLTTGQLGARLRRAWLDFDPDAAHHRYNAALQRRQMVIEPNPDGTADLHATDLPAERAMAIRWRIQRIARALKKADDGRTLDQIRADVMLDLLEGTGHADTVGAVEIRVDLETLLDLNDRAAEIPGYGPIVADIARKVATNASRASFAVEQPDGTVDTGTTRAPRAGLRRDVTTGHRTCVFPGCRMPSSDCDLDHTAPWSEGGQTTAANLAPLCRHDHHRLRHTIGWGYIRLPDGSHQWHSPLGLTYVTPARAP